MLVRKVNLHKYPKFHNSIRNLNKSGKKDNFNQKINRNSTSVYKLPNPIKLQNVINAIVIGLGIKSK